MTSEASRGRGKSLVIERYLDAPIESVWEALTDSLIVSAWFAPSRIEPWLGGKVCFSTATGETTGVVTRFEPPRLLEFTWQNGETTNSTVRVELSRQGKGCRLRLNHELDSGDQSAELGKLWMVGLGQLGTWLSFDTLRKSSGPSVPNSSGWQSYPASSDPVQQPRAARPGRTAWYIPIALAIVIAGVVAAYGIYSGFGSSMLPTAPPGPNPSPTSPRGTGPGPNSTGPGTGPGHNSTGSTSPLLQDQFWNDSTLNSSVWVVNGPASNASLTHWAAHPQFPVSPLLTFSRGSGLELSGVVSNFTWASIETRQSFMPPFSAQVTVKATVSNGNPIAFLISPTTVSTGVGIYGNMNPDNPYYSLGGLAERSPGLWTGVGNDAPSPQLDTWYTLTINVNAVGSATVTIEMGGSLQASGSFDVGVASYHVILGMFVAQPPPGNGPNASVWNSAYVNDTAAASVS